jgi:hypothetical protein
MIAEDKLQDLKLGDAARILPEEERRPQHQGLRGLEGGQPADRLPQPSDFRQGTGRPC